MAKIYIEIEKFNINLKKTDVNDKFAYKIFRMLVPKKTDFDREEEKPVGKPKEEPKAEEKPSE